MAVVGVYVAFLLILSVVQASDLDTSSSRDECPPLWTRFGDNYYRFFGTPKNWQAAENHCQEFVNRYGQGHLASVRNQEENLFLEKLWLSSLVPHHGFTGNRVWVGLNDIVHEGSFVWSDGSDVGFTQWDAHQPDNAINEDCGVFWGGPVGWNDQACSTILPYICKISSV